MALLVATTAIVISCTGTDANGVAVNDTKTVPPVSNTALANEVYSAPLSLPATTATTVNVPPGGYTQCTVTFPSGVTILHGALSGGASINSPATFGLGSQTSFTLSNSTGAPIAVMLTWS